jgi:hypothetical protein
MRSKERAASNDGVGRPIGLRAVSKIARPRVVLVVPEGPAAGVRALTDRHPAVEFEVVHRARELRLRAASAADGYVISGELADSDGIDVAEDVRAMDPVVPIVLVAAESVLAIDVGARCARRGIQAIRGSTASAKGAVEALDRFVELCTAIARRRIDAVAAPREPTSAMSTVPPPAVPRARAVSGTHPAMSLARHAIAPIVPRGIVLRDAWPGRFRPPADLRRVGLAGSPSDLERAALRERGLAWALVIEDDIDSARERVMQLRKSARHVPVLISCEAAWGPHRPSAELGVHVLPGAGTLDPDDLSGWIDSCEREMRRRFDAVDGYACHIGLSDEPAELLWRAAGAGIPQRLLEEALAVSEPALNRYIRKIKDLSGRRALGADVSLDELVSVALRWQG